jgi:hypothetical protein
MGTSSPGFSEPVDGNPTLLETFSETCPGVGAKATDEYDCHHLTLEPGLSYTDQYGGPGKRKAEGVESECHSELESWQAPMLHVRRQPA